MDDIKTKVVSDDRATTVIGNNKKTDVLEKQSDILNDRSTVAVDSNIDSRQTVAIVKNTRSTVCIGLSGDVVQVEDLLGEVIDDEYKLEKVLSANSGQSVVYLASKEKSELRFVCKLYRDDTTVIDPKVVELLANGINSKYVIKVVKYGVFKNRFYTITPYYEEGSVIEHIEEIDENHLKKEYINQMNEGLNAIHEAGIFHCDIKPHNIFFTNNRKELVIGDFGIALRVDKFDTIKTKYGEAIAKRDLQKNNATIAYLAQEGDEYATREVDYFALGMTILNMAHKGDIYSDVEDNVVRDKVILEGVRIPDNVDAEIAMLALKMLESDPKKRIGYQGVKKWTNDTSCYGKYNKNYKTLCPVAINNAVFNGVVFNSTEDYSTALIENFNDGLEYFNRDGIINDLARADVDRDFIKKIYEIKKDYVKSPENGFILTLMTLNPSLDFRIKNKIFYDFKGYISYLDEFLIDGAVYYDEKIILKEIENEFLTKKLEKNPQIIDICNLIFSSSFNEQYKAEMLRNYFTKFEDLIIEGEKYKSISDLSNLLFSDDLKENDCKYIFNPLFLNLISTKYSNLKDRRNEFEKIFSIDNKFSRNAQFSILLTNGIVFSIDNNKIRNMSDVIALAKNNYENNINSSKLCKLLNDGSILKFYKEFKDNEEKLVNVLSSIKNKSMNDSEILTYFYNATQEFAVFMLGGQKINDLGDIYKLLSSEKDIEKLSSRLIKSTQFYMWLNGSGYGECVKILERVKL